MFLFSKAPYSFLLLIVIVTSFFSCKTEGCNDPLSVNFNAKTGTPDNCEYYRNEFGVELSSDNIIDSINDSNSSTICAYVNDTNVIMTSSNLENYRHDNCIDYYYSDYRYYLGCNTEQNEGFNGFYFNTFRKSNHYLNYIIVINPEASNSQILYRGYFDNGNNPCEIQVIELSDLDL